VIRDICVVRPYGNDPACLLSAIQLASNKLGKTDEARNAVVHAQVHLGKPTDMDGFGLEVEIQVEGVSQDLVDAGHAVSVDVNLCHILY
jgi:hypothetical protein